MNKKKIFCFDIDNVICKTKKSYYAKSIPNKSVINLINHLYKKKHIIKIFTARYMGRHNDNKNIVEKKYYDIVFTQLKKWKINFHSLTLGKPSSDYYIDDKCVTFNKNWLNIIKKKFLL
jgi:hypothetical protein